MLTRIIIDMVIILTIYNFFFKILRISYPRNRLTWLYLAKLSEFWVPNAFQLRALFSLFNFFDASVTHESFVQETHVWHTQLKYGIYDDFIDE